MTLQEISDFNREIKNHIITDPETAFEYFKNEWLNLTYDDKLKCGPFILKFCFESDRKKSTEIR